MKQNQDYKNAALAALKGNWKPAVLTSLIILLIPGAEEISSIPSINPGHALSGLTSLLSIFVSVPLGIGFAITCKRLLVEGDNNIFSNSFKFGFKANYWRNVLTGVLQSIYIILWTLLLIVPGIIKAFSYAMTYFILDDYPELTPNQAIDKSIEMMKGHKFDLFYLYLSFIGWFILAILTLGIGLLWLEPYLEMSVAAFYQDVKAEYEAKIGAVQAPQQDEQAS